MHDVGITDGDGGDLGCFQVRSDSRGVANATNKWLIPGRACEIAAATATNLAGRRIVLLDRADVAAELMLLHASLRRHSLLMAVDLAISADTPLPPDGSCRPIDPAHIQDYGMIVSRAYPPDHPDHEPADADPHHAADSILTYLTGTEIGPLIAEASAEAVDRNGRVVGGIIVNGIGASLEFEGGPWITDLFVDPDSVGCGVGTSLLTRAIAQLRLAGYTTLGLAVTFDNPAQRLYRRLGWSTRHEIWRMQLAG